MPGEPGGGQVICEARVEMVDVALKALKRLEIGNVGVRSQRVGKEYKAHVDHRQATLAWLVGRGEHGGGEVPGQVAASEE